MRSGSGERSSPDARGSPSRAQWTDATPQVRALLDDEVEGLREAAESALLVFDEQSAADGRSSQLSPGVELIPDLLRAPVQLKPTRRLFHTESGSFQCRFGTWFDGRPGAVAAYDRRLELLGADGQRLARVSFDDGLVHRTWAAHTASGEAILVATVGEYRPDSLVGIHKDGTLAWSYRTGVVESLDVAAIHGHLEPSGFAVSGFAGLIGIDVDGSIEWKWPEQSYWDIASHRAFPDLLLAYSFAEATVIRVPSTTEVFRVHLRDEKSYFTEGILFPDAVGAPALVMTGGTGGNYDEEAELLVRCDSTGSEVWRTLLPDRCSQLTLVEIDGRRPLIAVAVDGGRFFLFDEGGTLLHQGLAPWTVEGGFRGRSVSDLSSGRFEAGKLGLLVNVASVPWLYLLDPSALESR